MGVGSARIASRFSQISFRRPGREREVPAERSVRKARGDHTYPAAIPSRRSGLCIMGKIATRYMIEQANRTIMAD